MNTTTTPRHEIVSDLVLRFAQAFLRSKKSDIKLIQTIVNHAVPVDYEMKRVDYLRTGVHPKIHNHIYRTLKNYYVGNGKANRRLLQTLL